MATTECPVSERYKHKLVEAQPWDKEYRQRALTPPQPEEYERMMDKRDDMPTDRWLQQLEAVTFGQAAEGEIDWEQGLDADIALRIAGGSLAVGVIDSVVSVRELIETMVGDAERIMRREGGIGRLLA